MPNYHAAAYIAAVILFVVAAFDQQPRVAWQWLACACVVVAIAL